MPTPHQHPKSSRAARPASVTPDDSTALTAANPSEMDHTLTELADLAVRYPFRWFSQGKVARICGFGEDVLSALAIIGAPVIARKCNPHLLQKWLEDNLDKIGKIRPE